MFFLYQKATKQPLKKYYQQTVSESQYQRKGRNKILIYLDNSATTNPKPQAVINACANALRNSANPGRSAHQLSLSAAKRVYDTRCLAAEFFGAAQEDRVIFTPSCTFSLNTAIKSVLSEGGHAVVSSLEHNAVMRPLEKLRSRGVTYSAADVCIGDNDRTIDNFRKCIKSDTKAIICTHASNVFGIRLPAERLCALAHAYGLVFILDAAQSAGIIPVNMEDGYDIVCAAPHKGLYAPMGTGLMILSDSISPDTLIEGGTGSNSLSQVQPEELPDKFESGTLNYPGISGIYEGISFVKRKGISKICKHEISLLAKLFNALQKMPGIILYTPEPSDENFVPVLSFNIKNRHSEETARHLQKYGIAVRAGLHCAPCAHRSIGTLDTGTVRISPSAFTSERDIEKTIFALSKPGFMAEQQ